jgi:hypothetical protein
VLSSFGTVSEGEFSEVGLKSVLGSSTTDGESNRANLRAEN